MTLSAAAGLKTVFVALYIVGTTGQQTCQYHAGRSPSDDGYGRDYRFARLGQDNEFLSGEVELLDHISGDDLCETIRIYLGRNSNFRRATSGLVD